MEKAMEDIQQQTSEEKQRLLMDATKQMRDALREMNTQTSSKEVSSCRVTPPSLVWGDAPVINGLLVCTN